MISPMNRKKNGSIVVWCSSCGMGWYSVAKRRFTRCVRCHKATIVNRKVFI